MPTSSLPVMPTGIFNPFKAQVYLAGAQACASGVITKILFDSIAYDTSGDGGVTAGFSVASSTYKVPTDGFYVYTVAAGYALVGQATVQQTYSVSLYKNGASVIGWQFPFNQLAGANVSNTTALLAHSSQFLQGDVLDARFLWNTTGVAANCNLTVGAGSTVFAIHLLSK